MLSPEGEWDETRFFFLVSPHPLLGHTALLHCRWLNSRPSGPKINDQLPAV